MEAWHYDAVSDSWLPCKVLAFTADGAVRIMVDLKPGLPNEGRIIEVAESWVIVRDGNKVVQL
jgi:hypothetical protein